MFDCPILTMLCGAPGAGKTTFYESKLKLVFPRILKASSSPMEQAEVERKRKQLQKNRVSFVYQDAIPNTTIIREARAAHFDVRVIYIGTEDTNLNIGRILIRVNHGGSFAPVARVARDFELGLKQLRKVSKQADDLMLFDNTPHGRGVSLIAHFQNGKLARVSRSAPKWAKSALGKDVGGSSQSTKPSKRAVSQGSVHLRFRDVAQSS